MVGSAFPPISCQTTLKETLHTYISNLSEDNTVRVWVCFFLITCEYTIKSWFVGIINFVLVLLSGSPDFTLWTLYARFLVCFFSSRQFACAL